MFAQVRVNAERNFALRATLRFRSMRGYDHIAAAQLSGCHPAWQCHIDYWLPSGTVMLHRFSVAIPAR